MSSAYINPLALVVPGPPRAGSARRAARLKHQHAKALVSGRPRSAARNKRRNPLSPNAMRSHPDPHAPRPRPPSVRLASTPTPAPGGKGRARADPVTALASTRTPAPGGKGRARADPVTALASRTRTRTRMPEERTPRQSVWGCRSSRRTGPYIIVPKLSSAPTTTLPRCRSALHGPLSPKKRRPGARRPPERPAAVPVPCRLPLLR